MSAHRDLLDLAESADRFATIVLPTPSRVEDASHRFDIEWKNARSALSDTWSEDDLAAMDGVIESLPHDGGPALVLIHGRERSTPFVEFLDEPVDRLVVHEDPVPRLATVIEGRQRAISHVVVETDRAGADLTAFAGSDVVSVDQVNGETLHIHRSGPGGWSQRRFQQRAENTWEHNAEQLSIVVDWVSWSGGDGPGVGVVGRDLLSFL